jgi:hypothetical protein
LAKGKKCINKLFFKDNKNDIPMNKIVLKKETIELTCLYRNVNAPAMNANPQTDGMPANKMGITVKNITILTFAKTDIIIIIIYKGIMLNINNDMARIISNLK